MLRKLLPKKIKRLIKIVFFYGNKFKCPICGYTARKLEPVGNDFPVLKKYDVVGGGNRRTGCYNCQSDDRERLIYLYLKDDLHILDSQKQWKVLHIAPEKNLHEFLSTAPNIDYTAGDKFTGEYEYPENVIDLDVLDLPFADAQFDLIICSHVLEHIPDDTKALRELYRILKTEGIAILQVPFATGLEETYEDPTVTEPKEREQKFGQKDHVRIYGQDYTQRLEKSGFVPKLVDISKREAYQRFALNPRETIFIGTKIRSTSQ